MLRLGVNLRTIPVTGNYTVSIYDDIINVDASLGNVLISLPDATLCPGKPFVINKTDATANQVTVRGLQPINGVSAGIILYQQNESVDVASVGGAFLSVGMGSRSVQNYSQSSFNFFLNADLQTSQRIPGNSGVTISGNSQAYNVDRWAHYVQGASSKNLTITQDFSDTPTIAQAGHFIPCSLVVTNNLACNFGNSSDLSQTFFVYLEGYDYQRIHGKPITLGFWFKSSVAGQYPIALTGPRSYVTSFTIPFANTWTFIRKTIQLETTTAGYNPFDFNSPVSVIIGSAAGSSFVTANTNQWTPGFFVADASTANTWGNTAGAVMKLAAPQLVEGTTVEPSLFSTRNKGWAEELKALHRYCYNPFYPFGNIGGGMYLTGSVQGTTFVALGVFPSIMRANPSMVMPAAGNQTIIPVSGPGLVVTSVDGDTRTSRSGYFINIQCANSGFGSPIPAGLTATNNNAWLYFDADY